MVEKNYNEYEKNLKNFIKKPLVPKKNDFNIFPPEKDVKKSEDQEASVLPTAPKLSMRKKTQFVDFEEAPEGVERIRPGTERWKNIVNTFVKGFSGEGDVYKEAIMEDVANYEVDESVNFGDDISFMVDDVIKRLENRGIKVYSSKKIVVGSKIITSTNKKAEVIKVSGDLVYWVSGKDDFGSDFIKDVKIAERKKKAGTWSLPFTVDKASDLEKFVNELKGGANPISEELYNLYGDDDLMDDLQTVLPRAIQIIQKHIRKLLSEYKSDPEDYTEKLDPDAEIILRSI